MLSPEQFFGLFPILDCGFSQFNKNFSCSMLVVLLQNLEMLSGFIVCFLGQGFRLLTTKKDLLSS